MINELLAEGKENAKTGKELAKHLGCNIRDITQQVEKERRQGKPICATTHSANPGYYLAANEKELNQYCDAIKRRAVELFKTRQALIRVLKQIQEGGADIAKEERKIHYTE